MLIAVGALASVFAPLLIVYCLGAKPTEKTILLMMAVGFLVTVAWRLAGLDGVAYEVMPGMIAGLLMYPLGQRLTSSEKS